MAWSTLILRSMSLLVSGSDGDGYGDPTNVTIVCDAPQGYVADMNDCDDVDPNIHPAVDEL